MPEILVAFKNLLSKFRNSPMKLSALGWGGGGGGEENLKKVCTVVMRYTSNGDDYQSLYI